ncbi:MAG: hypothetical protein DDT34_01576 [Firmicutes bacterium]|nr:hypothetical protein [Bacillota bacterium]
MGYGFTERHTPTQVIGLNGVTAIASGEKNTVALKSDGTVWALGNNDWGQLGDGTTAFRHTIVKVSGLTEIVAIAVGSMHAVALKSDGTVWAWGRNNTGQIGDDTTTRHLTPVRASGLTGVTAISAGGWYFTVALRYDGKVWAWGNNEFGHLGDGTTTDRLTPHDIGFMLR